MITAMVVIEGQSAQVSAVA